MNTLMKKFFQTNTRSWALLFARLALGIVVLPHGMQKALGMFGGHGFEATLNAFQSMGFPLLLAVLVISAEFIGALGLILGLGTRFMAFSISLTLGGAMFIGGHVQNGFFMNWSGSLPGEGIEYFILIIGLSLTSMFGGSGRFSFDNLISKFFK